MAAIARLSALDAAFLDLESTSVPFVVGSFTRYLLRVRLESIVGRGPMTRHCPGTHLQAGDPQSAARRVRRARLRSA